MALDSEYSLCCLFPPQDACKNQSGAFAMLFPWRPLDVLMGQACCTASLLAGTLLYGQIRSPFPLGSGGTEPGRGGSPVVNHTGLTFDLRRGISCKVAERGSNPSCPAY